MHRLNDYVLFTAEQELAKLQRQHRIMEGDRKAYSEESQNIIRKQRVAVESLQNERTELLKDIKLAGSQQNLGKVDLVPTTSL